MTRRELEITDIGKITEILEKARIVHRGKIELINEPSEKQELMSLFMKSQTNLDFSFTEKQVSAVCVLKVNVSEYTAKRRPTPMERHDMMTADK